MCEKECDKERNRQNDEGMETPLRIEQKKNIVTNSKEMKDLILR